MTNTEAQAKWEKCLAVIEQLAKEFPCPHCDGTGDGEPQMARDYIDGVPCRRCWGRGFRIPDEEED